MKKIALVVFLALTTMLGLVSCNGDKMNFVGRWGVAQIDYYNIDYAGQPIEASRRTYFFTPGDTIDGIDLVFNANKTGRMIDRSRDTVYIYVDEGTYDTISCPDTVLYTPFTYSIDEASNILYMNMPHSITYRMEIKQMDAQSFTYVNQYYDNIVEEALLKRLPSLSTNNGARKKVSRPHMPGSLLGR